MQLNRENLNALAVWLEQGAPHETLKFDMSTGMTIKVPTEYDPEAHNACITACCLAGAAVTFFDHPQQMIEDNYGQIEYMRDGGVGKVEYQLPWYVIKDEAVRLLFGDDSWDSYRLADRLFTPQEYFGGDLNDYNDPAWAARTVRHLMDTGDVDWKATYTGNASEAPWRHMEEDEEVVF